MRKILKFYPKILLALVVLVVLVTLLGSNSHTPHLLDIPTPSPTPAVHVSLNAEGNLEESSKNDTPHISPAETRAEKKLEGIQFLQDPLLVSHESYIQNPPPKGWVEVKKTKPKVKKTKAGKTKAISAEKRLTAAMKVVGLTPTELQNRAQSFPEDSVSFC